MITIQQHIELIKAANKITNRKTLYAAGAGLIPFPIVDMATLLGVQLTMIQSIAQIYGIEFKEHIAKSLIGSFVGSVSSTSLVKLIPGIGTILGGATASLAGAASTYALGKVFTQHFDQGGTLLDFDPISSREYFQKEYKNGQMFVADQDLITPNEVVDTSIAKGGASIINSKSEKELLIAETEQLYIALLGVKETLDSLIAAKANSTAPVANKIVKVSSSSRTKKKVSPKPKSSSTINKVADFTIIEGIGKKIDEALKTGGIYSMENLSKTKVDKLQQLLKAAKGNFNFADPTSWPEQAALAAAGKMEALKVLQDELLGGRIKDK